MCLYEEIPANLRTVNQPSCIDVYKRSHEILSEIVDVIKDDGLSDPECFQKIEAIVSILNQNGIDTERRHDFG